MEEVWASAAQGIAAVVLVPGGHEQAQQRHGNQTEHDAAEQGFDHGGAWVVVAQFFHERRRPGDPPSQTVTGTPPTPDLSPDLAALPAPAAGRGGAFAALLVVMLAASLLMGAVLGLPALRSDPYTRTTLALSGSVENGGRLFRLNCAGCHGLAAQGLVGPNLHGVDRRKNDRQLIQQVVSGRTPPMPRFQPEPQAMADLLAFLHSLP